jgi:predicted ribosomally synthesized peptide with SipW-like signal peptide
MPQETTSAIMVREQPRRRKLVALIGAASLGAALVTGVTIAAFTDSEYAHFGGDPMKAASYNIQIRETHSDAWKDTAIGGTPDNIKDLDDPISLTANGPGLVPGDPNYALTASFEVRNDQESIPTDLTLKVLDYADMDDDEDTASDAVLLAHLRFDIEVSQWDEDEEEYTLVGAEQAITFDALQAVPFNIAMGAAAGEEFKVDVTTYLDADPNPWVNNSMQGKTAQLIAKVDGTSV